MTSIQSPLPYPRVIVAGQSLEVKLSLLAEFALSGLGLDLPHAIAILRAADDLRRPATLLKLFTAMVAHNFAERGQAYPSPEDWALQVEKQSDKPADKQAQLSAMYDAVYAVILTALRESAEKNAPKPAPEMPVDPPAVQ